MINTEQKIIEAAIMILNDDLSATMEVIANKANLSRRTLHHYFSDRNQLIEVCKKDMMITCKQAMEKAYDSSSDPVIQLEQMLYAGIDCNYRYSFLNKLQQRIQPRMISDDENSEVNDNVKNKWHALVILLQNKGVINNKLTPHWIFFLFDGMISTTITAMESGDVANNEIKKFAWLSFSASIGIS